MIPDITSLVPSVALLIFGWIGLASLGGITTYVIIVVANRAEPDPSGKRPMAVYLFGGAFLTLWVAVIGLLAAAWALIGLIGTSGEGHAVTILVTIGLLLLVIAGGFHQLHRLRGLELAEGESDPASPTKRVARSYVAVNSFISIVIVIFSAFFMIYEVISVIAPGTYDVTNRTSVGRLILDAAAALLVSLWIFLSHQRLAPNGLRLFSGSMSSGRGFTRTPPMPPEPVEPQGPSEA